jgi:C1A family cysteine protease
MAIRKKKLIQRAVPVEQVPELSPKNVEVLKAYWIDSAQELVGIAASEPGRQALAAALKIDEEQLVEIIDAASKQVPQTRSRRLLSAARAAEAADFNTGSVLPEPELIKTALSRPPYVTVAYPADLPPAVDRRSEMPPIRSQGDRATCVAHASCAVREHLETKAGAAPEEIDLSEQFVYWYCKERDGLPTVAGTFTELGFECMEKVGAPAEQYWSYNPDITPGDESQGPPPQEALDHAAVYKIERVIKLNPGRALDLKTCLAEGKVIMFAIPVFDSWYYSAAVKRYGKITMPLPGEEASGGHAMTIVGYQDDADAPGGGYFIIRNSWSPWGYQSSWGEGYGIIPYAYLEEHGYETVSADRFSHADVYIRDSDADDGRVPGAARSWNSPDIWVRHAPDGVPEHQNPVQDRTNYLYVSVHNCGQAVAYHVKANVYTCALSPSIWPRNWKLLRTLQVPSVQPGTVVIGPLEWRPKDAMLCCYLVRLESPDDPIQHDWSAQWDNNIAQKNLAVMDLAPGEEGTLRFVMHGLWGKLSKLTLEVNREALPSDDKLELQTASRRFGADFAGDGLNLKRGQQRSTAEIAAPVVTLEDLEIQPSEEGKVTARIRLSKRAAPGAQHEVVFTQRLGPLTIGRLSVLIRVKEPQSP